MMGTMNARSLARQCHAVSSEILGLCRAGVAAVCFALLSPAAGLASLQDYENLPPVPYETSCCDLCTKGGEGDGDSDGGDSGGGSGDGGGGMADPDGKLDPGELQDLVDMAAAELGLEIEWGDPQADGSVQGAVTIPCSQGNRSAQLRVTIDSGEGESGKSGHAAGAMGGEGPEQWEVTVYDKTIQQNRSEVAPPNSSGADDPYRMSSRMGVLLHELMHLCRGDQDEDENDPRSCAHLTIDAATAALLCSMASKVNECLQQLMSCEPPDGLSPEDEQQWAIDLWAQLDCVLKFLQGLCDGIRQRSEYWGSEEGTQAANDCAADGALGSPGGAGACCNIVGLSQPEGGWTQDNPPIPNSCGEGGACE